MRLHGIKCSTPFRNLYTQLCLGNHVWYDVKERRGWWAFDHNVNCLCEKLVQQLCYVARNGMKDRMLWRILSNHDDSCALKPLWQTDGHVATNQGFGIIRAGTIFPYVGFYPHDRTFIRLAELWFFIVWDLQLSRDMLTYARCQNISLSHGIIVNFTSYFEIVRSSLEYISAFPRA